MEDYLEARNAGETLALRLAVGFMLRYPGADVRPSIAAHLHEKVSTPNSGPEELALKMFDSVPAREAFLRAYRSTLRMLIQ